MAVRYIILSLIGVGSGAVISGAVFAFIAIIGIVPRMAFKTDTQDKIKVYETAIILGGIFGAFTIFFNYYIPLNPIVVAFFGLCIGIFFGSLAVSLAEILDVIPILTRRLKIKNALKYFILSLAVGKAVGSALYYFVPGFYN